VLESKNVVIFSQAFFVRIAVKSCKTQKGCTLPCYFLQQLEPFVPIKQNICVFNPCSSYQDTLVDRQPEGELLHGGELARNRVEVVRPEEVEGEEGDDGVPHSLDEPDEALEGRQKTVFPNLLVQLWIVHKHV